MTTATLAGAQYGYALAWALLFATIAAIVLQEMAAKLGVIGRIGLGEAIANRQSPPALRYAATGLVIAALFVGNAAYEGGNLAGAALGLEAAFDATDQRRLIVIVLSLMAGGLLMAGGYKLIEKVLLAAVFLMSLAFGAALFVIQPDWGALLTGLLRPSFPPGALPLVLALIGTTIVPYNLFLHAAAARRRWPKANSNNDTKISLQEAQLDTRLSIGLGGAVSIFILSTAAASLFQSGLEINNAADMARQLEPAFGAYAKWLLAAGLFAAGLSSAVTAPLATGFAAAELFGFESDPKAARFRMVAGLVLVAGAIVAATGIRPVQVILFAQIANGILLPIIAVFLLIAANRKRLLGAHVNGLLANIAGGAVVIIAIVLGIRGVLRAFGVL